MNIYEFKLAGAKVQVTGYRSQVINMITVTRIFLTVTCDLYFSPAKFKYSQTPFSGNVVFEKNATS